MSQQEKITAAVRTSHLMRYDTTMLDKFVQALELYDAQLARYDKDGNEKIKQERYFVSVLKEYLNKHAHPEGSDPKRHDVCHVRMGSDDLALIKAVIPFLSDELEKEKQKFLDEGAPEEAMEGLDAAITQVIQMAESGFMARVEGQKLIVQPTGKQAVAQKIPATSIPEDSPILPETVRLVIPPELHASFDELNGAIKNGYWNSVLLLLRKITDNAIHKKFHQLGMEDVLKHSKGNFKMLEEKIQAAVEKKLIQPRQADQLRVALWYGNETAHNFKFNATKEDVAIAIVPIRIFLEVFFK